MILQFQAPVPGYTRRFKTGDFAEVKEDFGELVFEDSNNHTLVVSPAVGEAILKRYGNKFKLLDEVFEPSPIDVDDSIGDAPKSRKQRKESAETAAPTTGEVD